jgi:DNA polymerase III subunit gamma/tau
VIEIDGASNNSVEDIRGLRESVRYMPVHGKSKVYIVDEVHMLSKGAFNALLKTLEEPPPNVVFMFATTEPQRIPDTILSRVQRFDFKRIAPDVVVDRLGLIAKAEGVTIDQDSLRLIARAGEGSMRDSQSLLDQVISFAGDSPTMDQVSDILGLVDRKLLYQTLEGILNGDADGCLSAISAVYGYGYELSEFTSEMLTLIRNATLVGLSPSSKEYLDVPQDERGRLEELVQGTSSDVLVRAFHVMLEVHDQVAHSNRPRLVLEMAVARLISIRPAQSISRLMHRLEDLEHRIREAGGVAIAPPRTQSGPRSSDDDKEPSPVPEEAVPSAPVEPEEDPAEVVVTPDVIPEVMESVEPEEDPAEVVVTPDVIPEVMESVEPEEDSAEVVITSDVVPEVMESVVGEEVVQEVAESSASPALVRNADSAEEPEAQEADVQELEEEEDPDALPVVPDEATSNERFAQFRHWLDIGDVRYQVWAQDSIFISCQPPSIEIQFPAGFRRSHAQVWTQDERLLKGVQHFFPGCTRIHVRERDVSSGRQTHREIQAEEIRRAQEELEQAIRDNADIQAIVKHFDAAIRVVHKDYRAPIPPVLNPVEEQ